MLSSFERESPDGSLFPPPFPFGPPPLARGGKVEEYCSFRGGVALPSLLLLGVGVCRRARVGIGEAHRAELVQFKDLESNRVVAGTLAKHLQSSDVQIADCCFQIWQFIPPASIESLSLLQRRHLQHQSFFLRDERDGIG